MTHDAPPSSLPPRPDHGGPAARLGVRRDVVRARLDGGAFRLPSHPVSVGGGDFRSCASTLVRRPLASLGSDPRGRRLPRSRGRTTVPRSMEARWLETLRGARIARRRAAGFQGNRVHVRDPRRQPLRRGLRRAQADLPRRHHLPYLRLRRRPGARCPVPRASRGPRLKTPTHVPSTDALVGGGEPRETPPPPPGRRQPF